MADNALFEPFFYFGLAALLGFLIGLEREISSEGESYIGARDFTLYALLGALATFLAQQYQSELLVVVAFVGLLILLICGYWPQRHKDPGLTTETAALLTFLLGALVIQRETEIAIALAILAFAVLFKKQQIGKLQTHIQSHDMQAVLLLSVISFIILPVLPDEPLASLLTVPEGLRIVEIMLSALVPYKLWLIVILVSFISFIGYVLIKLIGSKAGIGLTGLIGGLVSSTVTTLSFARRSREQPDLNRQFAVAIVLASAIMFPRLIVQIGLVNRALMEHIALPLGVMGLVGLVLAGIYFVRTPPPDSTAKPLHFDNPFSLKAAISFALIFAFILMLTRVATVYLGDAWLPLVALVSGLTDADAIAFSISDAQQAGLIDLDWAGFNIVLGALANTLMKLLLVLLLGHRRLFYLLATAFVILGLSGLTTAWLYYDFVASQNVSTICCRATA